MIDTIIAYEWLKKWKIAVCSIEQLENWLIYHFLQLFLLLFWIFFYCLHLTRKRNQFFDFFLFLFLMKNMFCHQTKIWKIKIVVSLWYCFLIKLFWFIERYHYHFLTLFPNSGRFDQFISRRHFSLYYVRTFFKTNFLLIPVAVLAQLHLLYLAIFFLNLNFSNVIIFYVITPTVKWHLYNHLFFHLRLL